MMMMDPHDDPAKVNLRGMHVACSGPPVEERFSAMMCCDRTPAARMGIAVEWR